MSHGHLQLFLMESFTSTLYRESTLVGNFIIMFQLTNAQYHYPTSMMLLFLWLLLICMVKVILRMSSLKVLLLVKTCTYMYTVHGGQEMMQACT